MILLLDGPADGFQVASALRRGSEIIVWVEVNPRPVVIELMPPGSSPKLEPMKVRRAVYRMSNDRTARFWCWEDEIPDSPLVEAMLHASDEDILKLINDLSGAG